MTRTYASLVAVLATAPILAAAPALAGSPDNPGAGGQFLQQEAADLKAEGSNVGAFLNETRDAVPGFNLGAHIQDFGDQFLGSTPNPDNDQGKGNDD